MQIVSAISGFETLKETYTKFICQKGTQHQSKWQYTKPPACIHPKRTLSAMRQQRIYVKECEILPAVSIRMNVNETR